MLPRNVLVPTDLGDASEAALDYALELARTVGAKVHLLHVIGLPPLGTPELGGTMTPGVVDSIVHEDEAGLAELAARKECPQLGRVLLRTGDARDVILQTAEDLGADLIVMGTHGRGGISRALLGSVTEVIVRAATCPVLTIHARARRASAG